jgi:hypothetical protein
MKKKGTPIRPGITIDGTPPPRTVEALWRQYERHSVHEFTPPKIRNALRVSFYSGLQGLIMLMQEAAMEGAVKNDEEAGALLESLFNESQEFIKSVAPQDG